jgi:hypothetical protein
MPADILKYSILRGKGQQGLQIAELRRLSLAPRPTGMLRDGAKATDGCQERNHFGGLWPPRLVSSKQPTAAGGRLG